MLQTSHLGFHSPLGSPAPFILRRGCEPSQGRPRCRAGHGVPSAWSFSQPPSGETAVDFTWGRYISPPHTLISLSPGPSLRYN